LGLKAAVNARTKNPAFIVGLPSSLAPLASGTVQLLVQVNVLLIRCGTGRERVGAADQLKLGGDLEVIQAEIITAVAADDLKHVGVAACRPAVHNAGWLAPQNRCPALPGLVTCRHACLSPSRWQPAGRLTRPVKQPSVIVGLV
jgi:hypothetical protein